MQVRITKYILSILILSVGNVVYAANATVKINAIIPDYMPDQIRFTVDANIGGCVSGTWLDRFGSGTDESTKRENNKIAYSTLLAALMAGKRVNVFVDESTCQVTNLQLSSQ